MSTPVLRRPARRMALTVLTTLAAALLSLLLVSTSAVATEGEGEQEEEHAEEAGGFGSGMWDGMLLAGGVGIVLGLVVFGASDPGGIKPTDTEHHDAAAKAHAEPPM